VLKSFNFQISFFNFSFNFHRAHALMSEEASCAVRCPAPLALFSEAIRPKLLLPCMACVFSLPLASALVSCANAFLFQNDFREHQLIEQSCYELETERFTTYGYASQNKLCCAMNRIRTLSCGTQKQHNVAMGPLVLLAPDQIILQVSKRVLQSMQQMLANAQGVSAARSTA
jgi:hypothetical protein